ncbi:hypothetical protein [Actinomadura macrotermitis]|uniref:Uncharacterized protein n=1 Tax=Actinomadura macrotermitis TaxID=2585200 RepID=A0A7K0C1F5_9ACTN|nr:hypothetical protein [Actinomadura macrotermitis]MQY07298.1 hypothetical protein [Actinomadura macrotermitis]
MNAHEPVPGGFERLCRELLAAAYPEADAQWLDEHTASAVAAADRAVALADRHADAAREDARAAMRDALSGLRTRGLSPDGPDARIETGAIALTASARPAGARFTVTLRADAADPVLGELAGLWLTARATGARAARLPVRYLGELTRQGVAVFTGLPAGRWTFDLLAHSRPGAFPMPAVETNVVAAATGGYAVAAPNGVLFVLHDPAGRAPVLEVGGTVDRLRVVWIRYRDRAGAARRLLVPLAPRAAGPANSRTGLPGFSPGLEWEAGDLMDPADLGAADAAAAADSVRAAADRRALRGWQELARTARPEVAAAIGAALAGL